MSQVALLKTLYEQICLNVCLLFRDRDKDTLLPEQSYTFHFWHLASDTDGVKINKKSIT